MNSFVAGTQIKLQGVFKVDSVETDPTTGNIRCLYKNPAGTVTTVTSTQASMVKSTTGTYYVLVTPGTTQVGVWHYHWEATAGVIVAAEDSFQALPPQVTT